MFFLIRCVILAAVALASSTMLAQTLAPPGGYFVGKKVELVCTSYCSSPQPIHLRQKTGRSNIVASVTDLSTATVRAPKVEGRLMYYQVDVSSKIGWVDSGGVTVREKRNK